MIIDARGRSCPEPVIMIKDAMANKEDKYEIIVDNMTSVENITRFAEHAGYSVSYEASGEDYMITITK